MARKSVHLWIKVDSIGYLLMLRYAEEASCVCLNYKVKAVDFNNLWY